jgi:hypothetical protein
MSGVKILGLIFESISQEKSIKIYVNAAALIPAQS